METRHLPISALSWASEQHDKIGRRSSSNKYFPIHAATFQPRWAGEGSRKHKTLSPTPATICTGLLLLFLLLLVLLLLLLLLLFVLDFYSCYYLYSCSYSCYYLYWTSRRRHWILPPLVIGPCSRALRDHKRICL